MKNFSARETKVERAWLTIREILFFTDKLSLEFKTITRRSSIGTYYIFDTLHLKQFNSQIDMSYNLIRLADILGNYVGQDKIFFKKITKPNSDDNLRDKQRSILIESSFLDNYQEEF